MKEMGGVSARASLADLPARENQMAIGMRGVRMPRLLPMDALMSTLSTFPEASLISSAALLSACSKVSLSLRVAPAWRVSEMSLLGSGFHGGSVFLIRLIAALACWRSSCVGLDVSTTRSQASSAR